jgi:hypothetical protein
MTNSFESKTEKVTEEEKEWRKSLCFFYLRNCIGELFGVVAYRAMYTESVLLIEWALSAVSEKDQFSKTIGRDIAEGRLRAYIKLGRVPKGYYYGIISQPVDDTKKDPRGQAFPHLMKALISIRDPRNIQGEWLTEGKRNRKINQAALEALQKVL